MSVDPAAFGLLASNLQTVWSAPTTDARLKKRIVRILINEVVANIDDATSEIVLIVHWAGGAHSEMRLAKPRSRFSGLSWCSSSGEAGTVQTPGLTSGTKIKDGAGAHAPHADRRPKGQDRDVEPQRQSGARPTGSIMRSFLRALG